MTNLQTERLNFRLWREDDYEAIKAFFSDEEQARFVGGTQTPEAAWRLLATYVGHYTLKGYSYLALEENSTQNFVGCVGLWKSEPWPELELGYWLIPEMQGKGYATEAAMALKNYAFDTLKVDTLVSYISPVNIPSQNLALRLGAVHDKDIELLDFGLHRVYRYSSSS